MSHPPNRKPTRKNPRQTDPAAILARATAKLQQLNGAPTIEFLRQPSGNRLKQLQGVRAGQHSIRINDQWRVCFFWDGVHARAAEITDYH
jgi:proteic killer suppression protein